MTWNPETKTYEYDENDGSAQEYADFQLKQKALREKWVKEQETKNKNPVSKLFSNFQYQPGGRKAGIVALVVVALLSVFYFAYKFLGGLF